MFGHDWEPAQATIVATHIKNTSGDGTTVTREYAADVVPASGVPFRALIQEPAIATNFWPPSIGDVLRVHADVKRQKAKFDKSDPKISYKAWKKGEATRFEETLTAPPAAAAAQSPAGAEQRLAELERLKQTGLLTDDEYAAKRAAIIAEL
jgi:hypothetical protein